jgi:transposase
MNSYSAPRKPYPTDLTDEQWARIEPLLPKLKATGRPPKYSKRELFNAILYSLRTGCSWRMLPDNLPPWKSVHEQFRIWRDDGLFHRLNDALRMELRVEKGRHPQPSIVVIDSQAVKTTEKGGLLGTEALTWARR